ncbi:MAG: hypothetical protein IT437_03575 [Phycisphaerales bacterium]|nr:hypothetical protein [Phycisphaerales bacterium]
MLRRPHCVVLALAGLLAGTGALAQNAEPTGRDLAGLRLPAALAEGAIGLSATRATAWREGDGSDAVTRVLLAGDVKVRLGLHEFAAARALVWIAPLPLGDPERGPGVYQVFAYFDRVSTPGADAAVAVNGDRLGVQGVFRTDAPVGLKADVMLSGRPEDAFVREGERELAVVLRRLRSGEVAAQEPIPGSPEGPVRRQETPLRPGQEQPGEPDFDRNAPVPPDAARLLPEPHNEPVFAADGLLTFATGGVHGEAGKDENTVTATGGVTVQYWDRQADRTIQITAERAVVFLDPGPLMDTAQFDVRHVRGLYLEGDVIVDDGHYRIRAPRVYYAVREQRAYIVDAVFSTSFARGTVPLYLRAKSIEQEAKNRWTARGVEMTNTAFFDPLLTLGTGRVTIERQERPESDGGDRTLLDARNMTLRAEGVPFFYFPRFVGDPAAIPIKALGVGNSTRTGGVITSTWDLMGLVGHDPIDGVQLDLMVDGYFKRGAGLGLASAWQTEESSGSFFAYTLPNDTGTDLTSAGSRLGHDGEFRGLALLEHTAQLSDRWSMQVQGAYISDETFVDALFTEQARSRREFENSLYLKRQDDNTVLTAEMSGTFNDFTANQYLLQTPGYTVQRAPEAAYVRIADNVFPAAPGVVTYSSEYRAGRLALNFTDPTASEFGFTTINRSLPAFGIQPNESIADRLRAAGYSEGWVTRLDTRQEIDVHLAAGPVNITPFLVGRLTAWDRDFSGFSPEADERYRTWGAAGIVLATELQHVDNGVESRLLDLHRIRHIIAPNLTLWTAGTNIDRKDLPVYDEGVEGIAEGTAVKIGIDQTWQTQRGGPGRWRSVDVFRLDTDLVLSGDDADPETPIGRWFDDRPELSTLGNYATIDSAWQVSEVVALAAGTVYDFDLSQQARSSVGVLLQHSPEFSTYGELRYINSQDQTYVNFGAQYILTENYDFNGSVTYDTDRGDIQFVSAQLQRSFSNVSMGVAATYNDVTGETSFGFLFQPLGLARGRGFGTQAGGAGRGRMME